MNRCLHMQECCEAGLKRSNGKGLATFMLCALSCRMPQKQDKAWEA